ncbi:hypothetical protein AB5I41_02965 [Sphingomonas sp. MMS24-JH45]
MKALVAGWLAAVAMVPGVAMAQDVSLPGGVAGSGWRRGVGVRTAPRASADLVVMPARAAAFAGSADEAGESGGWQRPDRPDRPRGDVGVRAGADAQAGGWQRPDRRPDRVSGDVGGIHGVEVQAGAQAGGWDRGDRPRGDWRGRADAPAGGWQQRPDRPAPADLARNPRDGRATRRSRLAREPRAS